MINDLKTQRKWKIQLTIAINFFSSKDSNETRTIYSKIDSMDIMIGNETSEIIEKLFDSLLQNYQKGLEKSMNGCEFVFDSGDLLHYKLHKISLNCGESYIDSLKWLKNKKVTINPKNNDYKCFQYAITVELNHENIVKDPQRISKSKSFINKHNWKEISFPSRKEDWKKFETNKKTIDLNIVYIPYNSEKIRPAYISKHYSKAQKSINSFNDYR